jgi:dCMP deaminase
MKRAVVAYIPVLHEGYRRFLERHPHTVFLITPGGYRPLEKDVRAVDAELIAGALRAWGHDARVLRDPAELAATTLILPDEDISHIVVERHFPRHEVLYDTVFLRWDKTKTVALLEPRPDSVITFDELAAEAERAAARSVDWWRQVGAAIRFSDGRIASAHNRHLPHETSAYQQGDPRSNFYRGVHLELSTAVHAEADLVADAARSGRSTHKAVVYVTDFPCPPCAKLLAGAGIARLYYRTGYAVLDGQQVLEDAGVEIVLVS